MAGPFVYRPPLTAIHYPQRFPYPFAAQQYLHTPGLDYPFYPDLRLPNIQPLYSGTQGRFPMPPVAQTTGQHVPRPLPPVDRDYRRWTPPPRSRSVPAVHREQRVQDPPRPLSRTMLGRSASVQRPQSRLGKPLDAGKPNRPGEQWLQDTTQFPRQGHANGRALFGNAFDAPIVRQRPTRDLSTFINPWINALNPRPRFIFDLSSPEYAPRVVSNGRRVRLTEAELMQPATYPPSTRMCVVIEAIPQWPCDIVPRSKHVPQFGGAMPPITLRDVLRSLYKHLNQCISHLDWDSLGDDKQRMVNATFTTRYNRHADALMERRNGVKRVDLLLEETKMVGLLWVGRRDGCEIMKLILQS